MITVQDIKDWSKPHPLARVISIKDRQGGRMSRFGNNQIEFSIVGGASGLYGDFETTFEVAILDKKNNTFVTKFLYKNSTEDVVRYMGSQELEKLVNSLLKKENLVVL